ncbi:MAG: hypothetical protein LC790_02065, partial [Actinobacteria bacterium]|nr:hypothetical protein [Actinomycetota bacterium]
GINIDAAARRRRHGALEHDAAGVLGCRCVWYAAGERQRRRRPGGHHGSGLRALGGLRRLRVRVGRERP